MINHTGVPEQANHLPHGNWVTLLITLYAFTVQSGDLMRFGSDKGSFGVSTALAVLIAICSLGLPLKLVLRQWVFRSLAVLVLWMLLASAFAREPAKAFMSGCTLAAYFLLATAAFNYLSDPRTVLQVLRVYCLAGLLGAAATVLDFAGIAELPGINIVSAGTPTGEGYVLQASGLFYGTSGRSAMAAYYSIVIVLGLTAPWICRCLSVARKIEFLSAGLMCLVALLLTHNRAGVLGPIVAVGCLGICMLRRWVQLCRFLLVMLACFVVLYVCTSRWFPDVWAVYRHTATSRRSTFGDSAFSESDRMRVVLFKHAVTTTLSNPIGHGNSRLIGIYGEEEHGYDSHNVVTQVIWGAGVFGMVWIGIGGYRAATEAWRLLREDSAEDPGHGVSQLLVGVLMTWVLVGMTHNNIGTGIVWVVFGALRGIEAVRTEICQEVVYGDEEWR